MLTKLWNDQSGSFVIEYILVGTIVSLGSVVGLSTLGIALNAELIELAGAISSISQSYSYTGFSTCHSSVTGSAAVDVPGSISVGFPNATPTTITITVST